MANVTPLARAELAEHEPGFELVEEIMGFVPNSMLTMARVPGLLGAFQGLGAAVMGNGLVDWPLVQMVAQVASTAAGCRYCQAHTAHTAERMGVSPEKLGDLWVFETSDHFDEAERVALRLAMHAGGVPNVTTEADFVALRRHYTEDQITAIVATISFFGFLNRWNDTMGTELESQPQAFGQRVLADAGWEPGKHRAGLS